MTCGRIEAAGHFFVLVGALGRLIHNEHKGGGVRSGGHAVVGLPSDGDSVSSGWGRGVGGRAVIEVIVARVAGGGSQHGDKADQSQQRKPAEPAAAARAKGQTAQAQGAGQQNCPGDGSGPVALRGRG
jgi:hypothetical protein